MVIKESQQEVKNQFSQYFIGSLGCVFLFAMHFFMQNIGGFGLEVTFNLSTWMAFSLSIAIGLYNIAINKYIRYSKLTIGIFFGILLLTIPILYPGNSLESVDSRFLAIWAGLIFFLILQQFEFSDKQKCQLLLLIIAAVIIEGIYGFVQYLILEPRNIFGYDTETNRPYGIFQQPNVMASFLATGLVISGYLLTFYKKHSEHSIKLDYVFYVIPLLTIPLLIALASRTGWLGAIIGVGLVLPYMVKYANRKKMKIWLITVLCGVIIGFLMINLQQKDGFVSNRADLESARRYIYPQTFNMTLDKPLTGHGYGNFEYAYTFNVAKKYNAGSIDKPPHPSLDHPHNELLFWAAEGGIVPVIALFFIAYLLLTSISQAPKYHRLALLSLFMPILLHTQLEYPFYHSAIHWIIFVMLVYWLDQQVSDYKNASISKVTASIIKISSPIIPIMAIFYMSAGIYSNKLLNEFERSNPKNLSILKDVPNIDVLQDRFNWDVYATYLIVGLNNHNKKLIEAYLPWGEGIIKRKPRSVLYKNLILAYQALGNVEKAKYYQDEANFLYPSENFYELEYRAPSSAVIQSDNGLSNPSPGS